MAAPDLYRALWRRRYMIIILTVLATGTAYYRAAAEPKLYQATSFVRVQQAVTDPTQQGSAIGVAQHLAQTYAQIVGTYAVGDRVYRQLNRRVPRDEIDISGKPVQDLELLYIDAKSHNPAEAAAVANAAPVVLRQFITQAGTLRDQIVTINPAGVPTTPISPHPTRTALLALLIALIFNGALALLIEFLSDRLPDTDDLEASLGRPVLATVPKLNLRPGAVVERRRPAVAPAPGTEVRRARPGRSVG